MLMTLLAGAAVLLGQPQQDTTITVPRGTRFELQTHEGEIVVRTWSRDAIAISADLPDREKIGLSLEGGVAHVRRLSHGADHMSVDYRVTVPSWMDLELGTVEGDITVEGAQGQVNVTSVEGNVRIRGGKGFVGVHTVEGEVDVSDVSGRLEVNSVDGNLSLTDINGDIYAESVDGDITMERIRSAEVEANTVDGDIYYSGSIAANGRYGLDSHDGDITLEVPEPLSASLSVSTFSGSFEACGYAVTMNSSGEPSKRRFRFTLGTGSARVDLESFDGTIRLSKPGCSD